MGEGLIDDVTVHPATRAMVEEYAAWYDRHFEPAWHDVVLTPPDPQGDREPWAFTLPKSSDHLRGMGQCYLNNLRAMPLPPRRPVAPPRAAPHA